MPLPYLHAEHALALFLLRLLSYFLLFILHYNKKYRHGIYYYLDGGRYDGEWVDDRIHGKGKSVYANGNVYDGSFSWLAPR